MKHDWVIDVLHDLRSFARANALPELADHLTGTIALARAEIAAAPAPAPIGPALVPAPLCKGK